MRWKTMAMARKPRRPSRAMVKECGAALGDRESCVSE